MRPVILTGMHSSCAFDFFASIKMSSEGAFVWQLVVLVRGAEPVLCFFNHLKILESYLLIFSALGSKMRGRFPIQQGFARSRDLPILQVFGQRSN